MRNIRISKGEHYHIYNRGNRHAPIFLDENDWIRFLYLILYFQTSIPPSNIGHKVKTYAKNGAFILYSATKGNKILEKYVDLVNFCIMPNHFHLTVFEREENGIARYMQRVLNSYTKYFNSKYKKEGHLFQGPYQAVHIKDNDQLLHLSAYIHRNPRELREWRRKEFSYPFSTLQDYVKNNRWGELLRPEIVLDQFKNVDDYGEFVESSPTKLLEGTLDGEHLMED